MGACCSKKTPATFLTEFTDLNQIEKTDNEKTDIPSILKKTIEEKAV